MASPARRNGMKWAQMYRQVVPGSKWKRRKIRWPSSREASSRRRQREEAIRDAS